MRVAFYTSPGRLMDKLIRLWTRSKFSHCELLFSDGVMFSASAWENKVRYNERYDLTHWEIVEIPMSASGEAALRLWCDRQTGRQYDWPGVLAYVFPFLRQSDSRYYCSELCAAGLRAVCALPPGQSEVTPEGLYRMIMQ